MEEKSVAQQVLPAIVIHECGHIITLLLFKKIQLDYKSISRLVFRPNDSTHPASVEGKAKYHTLLESNELSKDNKRYMLPVAIGLSAGYVFEDVFFKKSNFKEKLWLNSESNRDGGKVSCLLTLSGKRSHNANVLDDILESYKGFLSKYENLFNDLINTVNSSKSYSRIDNKILFDGDQLISLLDNIEGKMDKAIIQEFEDWFNRQSQFDF
jgi:hypothetical protein